MKIKYLSHAMFMISNDDTSIIIDPFFRGNPNAPCGPETIKADYIIVTHAHTDHFGDAIGIAQANGATIITTSDLANYCKIKCVSAHGLHIGGSFNFPFGRVKLTIAHHGSSIPGPDGPIMLGVACGVLIYMEEKTIYHSGDTGLFLDMKLIGEMNKIDCAILPIGDNYTMGVDDALMAVEFLNPAVTIPMHYGTFDVIKTADPGEFITRLEAAGRKAVMLNVGEEIEI